MRIFRSNRGLISVITCISAFILGYMNAHAALFEIGVFVSPQTGNMINMAIRIGQGDLEGFIRTLAIFGGFLAGCFLGSGLVKKISNVRKEFFTHWSFFFVPILLNMIFINSIPLLLMIFNLSFVSGLSLCFFRKIYDIEVNNCIITGNMRTIGSSLYEIVIKKNLSKSVIFWTFTISTFLFFFGALVLTLLAYLGRERTFFVLVIIGAVPYTLGVKLKV